MGTAPLSPRTGGELHRLELGIILGGMTPIRVVVTALPLLAAACASERPIVGRPPIPPGVNAAHIHFSDAAVKRGDVAPDFTLPTAEGWGEVTLSALRGRPVVLVFASHT
jgi:hypothetical protein